MIVVSNTTPLIGLAMADRFDLLKQIFSEIYVPHGVYEEIVEEGRERFGAQEVEQASWVHVVEVQDQLAVELLKDELDKGESEAIVLAKELGADWVLVDEWLTRRKLELLGIPKIGTLGILLKAKEVGLIDAVKPAMDKLRARGFRLSKQVYDAVLSAAGEN